MARKTPPEAVAKIRELLLMGKTQVEAQDAMRELGWEMSLGPIGKVAFQLESEGLIHPVRRKRDGMNIGGRPKGSTGAKWSKSRQRIIAVRMADPTLSAREIAIRVGVTPDMVRRILREFKVDATDDAKK